MKDDCGECKNCLDKPNFGGRGIKKQACEQRACCNPSSSTLVLPQPAPQAQTSMMTEVLVPAGVQPNQQIKFQRPGGGWIMVRVPAGVFAGQKFRVKLPAASGPVLKAKATRPGITKGDENNEGEGGSSQHESQKSEESDESDSEESFQALLSVFQGRPASLAAAPAAPARGVAATATPAKEAARKVKAPETDEQAGGAEAKSHSSQYRGVSGRNSRWRARIWHKSSDIVIGIFDTEVAAALAYDEKALRLHGPQALVNFPSGYTEGRPTLAATMRASAATTTTAAAAAKPPLPGRPTLAAMRVSAATTTTAAAAAKPPLPGCKGGGRWEAKVYWTHEEDLKVLDSVKRYGQNWARIARDLSRSHTEDAVRHRWHRLKSIKPSPSPLVKAAAKKNVLEHVVAPGAVSSPGPGASLLSTTTQERFDGLVTSAAAPRQLDGESSTPAYPLRRDKRASAIQADKAWRPQPAEATEPLAPKAKKAKLDPSPVHPIPGARTEVWASQDEEGEAKAKKGTPHSPAFKLRLVRSAHSHIDPDLRLTANNGSGARGAPAAAREPDQAHLPQLPDRAA